MAVFHRFQKEILSVSSCQGGNQEARVGGRVSLMDQEEEGKGKRMTPEPVVSVKLMIEGEILCDRTFTANDEDPGNCSSSSSSSSSSNSLSESAELATPGPGVYAYTGKHDDGPMAPSTASNQYYREVARSLKVSESNSSKHPIAMT